MRNNASLFIIVKVFILFTLSLFFLSCNTLINNSTDPIKKKDGPKERMERDIKMMKDPVLNYVPTDRLTEARRYRDELLQSQGNIAIANVDWRQLGPKNQGGRSRALLIDANDVTGNTIWAGSVGGGLWKTTDITAAEPLWVPVNDLFDNLAVTSIAQDPSTPSIMYFCTGEGYFNGDAIQGLGVWKTINSGATWIQLAFTNNNFNFYNCQKIVVNSSGHILVSTRDGGLQRSINGGTTFTKVLGTGLGITGALSNFCYDVDIAANGHVYSTLAGSIHKSTDAGATFAAAQTIPIAAFRIEIACAPSDPNYVFALVENGNVVNGILRTVDGGTNWISRTEPADADPGIPATDFSRGQAWYDLTIAVDPLNRDRLFVGGIDLFKSLDGANSWTQVSHWYGGFGFPNVHADQHNIIFRAGSSSIAYFVNDGGVYRTTTANNIAPVFADKGTNYITAQFYSCAIHPTPFTNYFLAGAQDNGSHQFTQGVIQNTTEVTGGDGAYCHIDQNQPQYQFTSYVFNDFYRSNDFGASWTNVVTTNGEFISPTDYDDINNRLYMCNLPGTYQRWDNPQTGATFATVTAGFSGQVSAVKVSPNTSNKVFFGIDNGDAYRVDNAHTATPTVTDISIGLPAGYLNCIEVQTGNDDHIIVTYTNYGLNSIWETTNGGTSWTSVEGNLPDMPIRWALFNPDNSDQAIIATELGVWSTQDLAGGATNWGTSNTGLANVRVDMLQLRAADKIVIAATHGRGLFLSDVFASPTALFEADKVTSYRGVPISFTSTSYNATSWSWNFGDAGTSTLENPSHTYATAGQFTVTLTINSGSSVLTRVSYIHILPNKGTPYTIAGGGNFEANPLDFGVDNLSGTPWQRGNSAVAGKNGVVSGANAWVTGLVGNYVNNSDARLLTPNYNFFKPGIYNIRFQAKRITEAGYDGFRVEYTLDSGRNWLALDPVVAANWYNFANTVGDASFPVNEAFFAGTAPAYSLYFRDISFLAGNRSVAFRFRFKSDFTVVAAGVAIDDFEITGPINGALAVNLINFTAIKKNNDALVNWRTENEIDINNYTVEKSFNGVSFSAIGSVPAKNITANTYAYTDMNAVLNANLANYLYYRLKINDRSGRFKYSEIAKISLNRTGSQVTIGPDPFADFVSVYSNEAIKNITVYDMSGKPVYQTANIIGNKVFFKNPLPTGIYIFKIVTTSGTVSKKMVKM